MYQDTSFYIRLMTKSKGSAKSQVRMGRSQCPLCWVACTLWYPSGTICIIYQNYLNFPNVWHPKYHRWGFIISVILMILLVWQITHWSTVLKSKRWGLTREYIWPKKKKKQKKKNTTKQKEMVFLHAKACSPKAQRRCRWGYMQVQNSNKACYHFEKEVEDKRGR